MEKNEKNISSPNETEQNETKSPKEKKKFSRAGKLYIATAICTASVCLVVLAITTQISRSITQWDKDNPIIMPTPIPVDSLLDGAFSSSVVLSEPTPAPAQSSAPRQEQNIVSDESNLTAEDTASLTAENESVPAGLFSSRAPFTLQLPISGDIINEFSIDRLKKSKTMGDWRTHNGIDIKAESGAAVNAAADGTVLNAGYDNSMGYFVILEHEQGYQTLYANLASSEMVTEGQKIKAGECLGAVGDSAVFEMLEEAHLHFELTLNGSYQNPLNFIS